MGVGRDRRPCPQFASRITTGRTGRAGSRGPFGRKESLIDALKRHIAEQDRALAEERKERLREFDRRVVAEEALEEERGKRRYVATTGAVLYSGHRERDAINAAQRHFERTREHVVIDGSKWNTRQRGGYRVGRRVSA